MTNEEHVALLRQGVETWNAWRRNNPDDVPELVGASLAYEDLSGVNLRWARLSYADLHGARLIGADLVGADLEGANLTGANLSGADLADTYLVTADFSQSELLSTDFHGANMERAELGSARIYEAVFANINLTGAKGLDSCLHLGPSMIDYRTIQRSGPLPKAFLFGCGLPNDLFAVFNKAPDYYSCFISYSSLNVNFAELLHGGLQDKGVTCWFAPEDMKIGAKILDTIYEAIRLRDKVLLILSEHSIASDWVEDEVTKAFAVERERNQTVLFPIRIDDAVMDTNEAWARKLRDSRHIGDFSKWKDHDSYKKGLGRLLRDLKVE